MAARSFHNYTKRRLYRAEHRERGRNQGGNRRDTRAERDAAAEPSTADASTAEVHP